jgi:hypothetical protein
MCRIEFAETVDQLSQKKSYLDFIVDSGFSSRIACLLALAFSFYSSPMTPRMGSTLTGFHLAEWEQHQQTKPPPCNDQ